jgi:hypothetical protein
MRPLDPAKVFWRAGLLLCGVALTWVCAAFGLLASQFVFVGRGCPARTTQAAHRVQAVEGAIAQFQIYRGRCPQTLGELADGGFVSPSDLDDPWHRSIVFTCAGDEARVASSGPDGIFGTPDDIRIER